MFGRKGVTYGVLWVLVVSATCGSAAEKLTVGNNRLELTFDTDTAAMTVLDKQACKTWTQQPVRSGTVVNARKAEGGFDFVWRQGGLGLDVETAVRLDVDAPEFTVEMKAPGQLMGSIHFPHPFVTDKGTHLVVPMNEGISYPVDDAAVGEMSLVAYGGHGICMAFWAATDGQTSQMAIIETPDDAMIRIARRQGLLCVGPVWESQKGQFGYSRRLRYVFLGKGGHVAVCKRYREYAKKQGLLKTLAQKRDENPSVDLLVGAVNVWCWDRDALGIVRDMKAAGIDRILWSQKADPRTIQAMNEMPNVLTSRYDIYQDLMDPNIVKGKLRGVHSDWTQDAFPHDIMLDGKGEPRKGWQVRGTDGVMYPCAVLCDARAVDYAKKRIPAELQTHAYRCRFIDTTTASPWRECYHPDHPMTRSDSRRTKMDLLRYVCDDTRLVTGCETGHDAAVPYVHYFEGMLSLGPYRVPDSGRDMARIWDEVPQSVEKFQMGHRYRLPLWELVYHDCVVAQWYWGDYNNKLPKLWDKRDLFNVLYGTPPMFMFTRAWFSEHKARFARSYNTVCPAVRAVGYSEMTDHKFLTPDRDVQQTTFANGVTVTVNFGDKPYRMPDGTNLEPMTHHVAGL